MTRRPSALKWLIEERARLAGDTQRYEGLLAELQETLSSTRSKLAALDSTLQHFDASIDPSTIPALKGFKGRYGPRGELRKRLFELITAAYPDDVTTPELALRLAAEFRLDFATKKQFQDWTDDSLAPQLKRFVKEGAVERLHDPEVRGEVGRWRRHLDSGRLDQCRATAQQAGVGTKFNDTPE